MTEHTTAQRLRTTVPAALTAALTVALMAAGLLGGCTDDAPPKTTAAAPAVRLYGSDGNMLSTFGAAFQDHPALLNGMKGTTPLTPLTEEFKRRVKGVDPQLADYNYAGEAYDAVILAALAAETARSTDGPQIAKYLTATTVAASGGVTCNAARQCVEAIRGGKDIAYRGVSLRRAGLTERGEPSTATYGTLVFGRQNAIDPAKTEYVGAGDERGEAKDLPVPPPPPSNGRPPRNVTPLKIGALLPHTGDLALAGPPMFAGAQLAVQELNEAGGVLGQPVQWLDGDDGTNPTVAAATVDQHLAAGVQVIIGAGGSGITKAVLPKMVAAQRVLISPSATSDELTGVDDKGFFFRTSPPDVLQARALVNVIMRYGAQRVAIVAREDSYGTGLRTKVTEALTAAGVAGTMISGIAYQVRDRYSAEHFAELATQTTAFAPDAVLVVGFEESAHVIKALAAQGMKFRD